MISVDHYNSSPSHEGFLNRMYNSVFLHFFLYFRKPKADTFLWVNKPQPLTIIYIVVLFCFYTSEVDCRLCTLVSLLLKEEKVYKMNSLHLLCKTFCFNMPISWPPAMIPFFKIINYVI